MTRCPANTATGCCLTQTGQRSKEFQGKLQFVVNLQQDDSKFVMTLPAEDDKDTKEYS